MRYSGVDQRLQQLARGAGDAALFIDPFDVAAISGGLQRLLTDNSLRDDLIARGRKRRLHFTWKPTAKVLADLLIASSRRFQCSAQ